MGCVQDPGKRVRTVWLHATYSSVPKGRSTTSEETIEEDKQDLREPTGAPSVVSGPIGTQTPIAGGDTQTLSVGTVTLPKVAIGPIPVTG
jgi:hypothetical protein